MHLFGEWTNPEIPSAETPIGRSCISCEKLIAAGDKGVIMPLVEQLDDLRGRLVVQHRECLLESIFGPRLAGGVGKLR